MLCCSAGHLYDPKNLQHVWWKGLREEGGSCPEVMDYDRMFGTTRCNRKLFDLGQRVEMLYNKMFDTYISPSMYNDYEEVKFFGGGNSEKYKETIRKLIISGKKVKVGYRCSSIMKNSHEQTIFYK